MADTPTGRASKRRRAGSLDVAPPTPSNAGAPVVPLEPKGDIIFVLHDGSRLLVHSVILGRASLVFNTMFGPYFLEGQNLSSASPKEVPLPEDDPAAMKILLRLLHHHHYHEDVPVIDVLQDFAMLVDKYNCLNSVRSTIKFWLAAHARTARLEGFKGKYGALLGIAALLDQPELFFRFSRDLMLYRGPTLYSLEGTELLPPGTLVLIAERTAKLTLAIRKTVLDCVYAYLCHTNPSQKCVAAEKEGIQSCSAILFANAVSDFMAFPKYDDCESIDVFIKAFSKQSSFNCTWLFWKEAAKPGLCFNCQRDDSFAPALQQNVKTALHEVEKKLEGLCIDCLGKNGVQLADSSCRVPHEKYVFL